MAQGTSSWEGGASLPPEEAQSLAALLAALDAQTRASGSAIMPGGSLLSGSVPEVAAEATRRLAAIFQAQVERVAHLLKAALCALYLAESPQTQPVDAARRRGSQDGRAGGAPGGVMLSLRALYGAPWNPDATLLGVPLPAGGPATHALLGQIPLESTYADLPTFSESAKARQVQRWLYVPMFGLASLWPQQRSRATRPLHPAPPETPRIALGVLAVGRITEDDDFTEADRRLLSVLGEQLVLALENARLSEQASLAVELGHRYQQVLERVTERDQIVEELYEGVLRITPGGQLLQVNARGRELLGWSGQAGLPGRMQDMETIQLRSALGDPLPIEDWPMFRVLRGQRLKQEEVSYTGPDQQERLLVFSGQPLWDSQGRLKQALLNFHEASSEQMGRAQLAQMLRLADQRAHYIASVLEAMTDGILVCNRSGMVLLVNPAGLRLLGAGGKRIVPGHYHLSQLIADFKVRALNGRPLAVENFALLRALRGETVQNVELQMRRPGSDHDWRARVSAAPIKDHAEAAPIVGAVAVLVDATEAHELEQAKDKFLALVVHELRSPLTAIRGFAQLLQKSTKRAPNGIERRTDMKLVDKIASATAQLTRLVDELTDAARADLDRFDLHLRPVPLGALLRHIAEDQQATTSRHKILVDAPKESLFVPGDEGRLEQVFHNLVANAIKYSPAGGEISISVIDVPESSSPVPLVKVAVRDQGQGIAVSDLERIFDRFERADVARTSKVQGLGLGLYIARRIVEAHGGNLWAESEGPGKGSTFIARLPRQA